MKEANQCISHCELTLFSSYRSHAVQNLFSVLGSDESIFGYLTRYILVTILLFCLATFLWRQYFEHAHDSGSQLPLPPGSMGFPLIGETLSFLIKKADHYTFRRIKHGNVYKTHIFGQPTVRVIGSANVRHILLREHVAVESSWPTSLKRLLGPGALLNSTPDKHRVIKKILIEALSPTSVAAQVPRINEVVRKHLRKWCTQGEQLGRDICKRMTASLAADILVGFSVEESHIDTILENFRILQAGMFSLPWSFPGSGLSKGLEARKILLQEISERMNIEGSYWSIVDELKRLKDADVSKDELADAILELWFASTDTSASTACSLLLAVGRDARICKKIEEELAVNGLLDPKVELTYDTLMNLTYVDHVIKEVVRLYPPAGGTFRKAKKTLEIGGYQILKGWKVICCIRDTHMTTDFFQNNEDFYPERWYEHIEKPKEIADKFHYIPFGAGARACPGERFAKTVLKTFIVEAVRSCVWTLKNPNPKIRYLPVTCAADGLPVTFTLRTEPDRSSPIKG